MGLCSQFWSRFLTTVSSRFDIILMILINSWYFLAHNFDAHLSGWVRVKDGAMARSCFELELVKGSQVGKVGQCWKTSKVKSSQNELPYSGIS